MSYVEAKPGNGPMLHNHDTNETFVAIKGQWRSNLGSWRKGPCGFE
jgi:quercetin dioxygenase-like cupin family protein